MSNSDQNMNRRRFLQLAGATAAAGLPTDTAAAEKVSNDAALYETAYSAIQCWQERITDAIARRGEPVQNLNEPQKALLRGDKEFYDAHFSFIPEEQRRQLPKLVQGNINNAVFIDVTNNVITAYRLRNINIDRYAWERAGFDARNGITEEAAFKNANTKPEGEIIPTRQDSRHQII